MLVSKIKEIRNGRVIVKDVVGENYETETGLGPNEGIIATGPGYFIRRLKSGLCQLIQKNKVTFEGSERECEKKAGHPLTAFESKDYKMEDRNLVDINKERRNLEDAYAQALKDGDKGLAKSYSDRLEELRKEAINAEDGYDPTKPENIAAAKTLSVAQGKAATGDEFLSCNLCGSYRKDTDTCRTGCSKISLAPGTRCPYDYEAVDDPDLLQTKCLCYN